MSQPVIEQDYPARVAPVAANAHPPVSPWIKIAAVGALATPVVLLASMIVDWRRHIDSQAKAAADSANVRQDIQSVRDEVRVGHAATWVSTRDVVSNCYAFNDRFECTVTNVKDEPIAACWVGRLAQKQGGGTMSSIPLCTGRVGPRQTRQVSVPWQRGNAKDICNSPGRFGPELDWDVCTFSGEPLDPSPAASPQ